MNKGTVLWILFIALGFYACGPRATFDQPQPADVNDLSCFPKKLQGEYLSLEDSTRLLISDAYVKRIYDFSYKVHPSQLDSNIRLSGDSMINTETSEAVQFKREADSLVAKIHYTDTLFHLDDNNVVRKYKGCYFLNSLYEAGSWEVKKIELAKGQLKISEIASDEDIINLTEITQSPPDSVAPYHFTATKNQFGQFLKKNGFSNGETFVKIK